mmetsp:Transcript_7639/g.9789  ORF Transcript_7639/g.9789 Transcript_7639/m.9789 type:complete len:228 (+) Transcript_7639:443-1126(+)
MSCCSSVISIKSRIIPSDRSLTISFNSASSCNVDGKVCFAAVLNPSRAPAAISVIFLLRTSISSLFSTISANFDSNFSPKWSRRSFICCLKRDLKLIKESPKMYRAKMESRCFVKYFPIISDLCSRINRSNNFSIFVNAFPESRPNSSIGGRDESKLASSCLLSKTFKSPRNSFTAAAIVVSILSISDSIPSLDFNSIKCSSPTTLLFLSKVTPSVEVSSEADTSEI